MPKIAIVESDIKEGLVNKFNFYPYEGLVRIIKELDNATFKGSVLKHLLNGGVIKMLHPNKRERLPTNHPDKYVPPFVLLEPSFIEYVLGDFKIIEVWPNQAEVEITISDLVFVKSEVDNYLKRKDSENSKSAKNVIFFSVYQNISITNIIINQSTTVTENNGEDVILSDDNIQNFETGKRVRERLKKFGEKAGKQKAEDADKYWEPKLAAALKKATENSGKWSASDLAANLCKDDPDVKVGTFRKKISGDAKIKPHLKQISKSKSKK